MTITATAYEDYVAEVCSFTLNFVDPCAIETITIASLDTSIWNDQTYTLGDATMPYWEYSDEKLSTFYSSSAVNNGVDCGGITISFSWQLNSGEWAFIADSSVFTKDNSSSPYKLDTSILSTTPIGLYELRYRV